MIILNYYFFIARQCLLDPPEPFFGIEMIWPKRSRDLATMITYNCPFRTGTWAQELKRKQTTYR